MSREVTIAAVQLPAYQDGQSNSEKREANFELAEAWLEKAGVLGADIACIGEHFNAMGQEITPDNLISEIQGVKEETIQRLGAVAHRFQMAIVAPIWGIIDCVPANSAIVLDKSGNLAGSYQKVHPTQMECSLGIVPGDNWPVFRLDFGAIGIQICHDNSFVESARCIALNGAEIIFWPHVMSGWGGEFMHLMACCPAIYNGIVHVPVSFGCQPDISWRPGTLIGRSSIIAPDGIVLADAGRYAGIAIATIDLDRPRLAHDFTRSGDHVWRSEMLADRRPETYQVIARSVSDDGDVTKCPRIK